MVFAPPINNMKSMLYHKQLTRISAALNVDKQATTLITSGGIVKMVANATIFQVDFN